MTDEERKQQAAAAEEYVKQRVATQLQAAERAAKQEAEERANAQLRAASSARKKELCALQAVCLRYASSRQACATAGNYNLCMSIKVGADGGKIDPCTDNGNVLYPPDDMP